MLSPLDRAIPCGRGVAHDGFKRSATMAAGFGYRRGVEFERIETYAKRIPDDALVRYADAVDSGLVEIRRRHANVPA